jgi:hypothetical protein
MILQCELTLPAVNAKTALQIGKGIGDALEINALSPGYLGIRLTPIRLGNPRARTFTLQTDDENGISFGSQSQVQAMDIIGFAPGEL